jgi:Spx/MgsR family transcriptional regulator
MAVFYYKSTCSTCRKARALLAELGLNSEERDMSKNPLTRDELEQLIGDRAIVPFLNPRNDEYRERGMRTNPPGREDALDSMARNANLIRRPLLVDGDQILFGFDEPAYRALAVAE